MSLTEIAQKCRFELIIYSGISETERKTIIITHLNKTGNFKFIIILLFFISCFGCNKIQAQCSPTDIEIKSFNAKVIDECKMSSCPFLKFTGEIINHCKYPTGVQIQIVARDKKGNVVDTNESWPASVSNIAPGESFPFSVPGGVMDYDPAMNSFSIKIIRVKKW